MTAFSALDDLMDCRLAIQSAQARRTLIRQDQGWREALQTRPAQCDARVAELPTH